MVIQGFILDIDGTLLSSHEQHLYAWQSALKKFNIQKTDQEILMHFGKPTGVISRILAGPGKWDLAEELTVEKTKNFVLMMESIRLFPGVKDALEKIADNGFLICFASSNNNRILEKMMDIYGWYQISIGFVGMDDVSNGKPDPEMILKAIKKMNLKSEECVTIGDSLSDIEAGHRAGTRTIGVCTGNNTKDSFKAVNPDIVLDRFADLVDKIPLSFENPL